MAEVFSLSARGPLVIANAFLPFQLDVAIVWMAYWKKSGIE